jgi:hypothetical protein
MSAPRHPDCHPDCHPDGWHPDADLLADVAERLANAETMSRVETHLAGCAECQALRMRLDAVTVILQSNAAPRMPNDVSARVLTALAAEPTPAAVAARTGSAGSAGSDWAAAHAGRRRHWLRRCLAAAAAVTAIAGIGAVGVNVFRPAEVGTSLSDDAGTSDSAAPERASGPAAVPPPAEPVPPLSTRLVSSGQAYTRENLGTAGQLLQNPQAPADSGPLSSAREPTGAAGPEAPALSRLRDQSALASCLAALPGRQAAPLLVDLAAYDGQPAAIVVVSGTRPDRLTVFVVGPACSSAGSELITTTDIRR